MDPIANMLTRIRNALKAQRPQVSVPFSREKLNLVKILEKKGYVEKAEVKGKKIRKSIEIILKYLDGEPVISGLKRISKPGRRVYLKKKGIRPVLQGFGIMIISTSEGLMTGEEARKKGLGGEVVCEIW